MRILLVVVHPVPSIFPQGIAYVAAALKAAGHEVFGININNVPAPASIPDLLYRELRAANERWQPEAMAVGGLSADYPFVKMTVDIWRRLSPHTPVILGGGIVTADADFVFESIRPDFAISGEAEFPMVQLAEALRSGGELDAIPGLRYRRDGLVTATPDAARSKVMPDYPWPDYDPFDLEGFFDIATGRQTRAHSGTAVKPRPFPVSAGRSCPFKCTFCFHASNILYRQRPVDDVIAEIVHFHEKYRYTVLIIYDELFSAIGDRIPEFCEKIKQTGLPIEWTCSLRVTDVRPDLLRQMKDAGCVTIGYGLESASDVVLHSMKKKITQKDIRKALAMTEEAGIAFQGNFIFGDPAETEETVVETMNFFKDHCLSHPVELGLIRPYPGTPIFNGLMQRGVITDKIEYYERIGRTNYDVWANYNMTAMPDEQFWQVVRKHLLVPNRRRRTTATAMRVCPPVEREGWEGRTEVVLTANCPHCGTAFDKSYDVMFAPMNEQGWQAAEMDVFHLCGHCSKTSNILVSPLVKAMRTQSAAMA